jgi:hypothetical protein
MDKLIAHTKITNLPCDTLMGFNIILNSQSMPQVRNTIEREILNTYLI